MTTLAMFLQRSLEMSATKADQPLCRAELEDRVFHRVGRCVVCGHLIEEHFDRHNRFVGCQGAH